MVTTTKPSKIFSFQRTDIWLLLVLYIGVVIAPFNKVEESFHTQAIFDIIYHGTNLDLYDHSRYPGVVPRTFVGDIIIASVIKPIASSIDRFTLLKTVFSYLNIHFHAKLCIYIICRLVLASIFWVSMIFLRCAFAVLVDDLYSNQNTDGYPQIHSSHSSHSSQTSPFVDKFNRYFIIFSCLQFHIVFYASRFLSNSFALILTNVAIAFWIHGEFAHLSSKIQHDNKFQVKSTSQSSNTIHPNAYYAVFLTSMGIASTVFRCDILPLFGVFILISLWRKRFSFFFLVKCGIITCIIVAYTVYIDSWYWQSQHKWAQITVLSKFQFTWPELAVLKYNTFYSKSSNWGTLPFWWYYLVGIPKVLSFSIVSLLSLPVLLIFSSGMKLSEFTNNRTRKSKTNPSSDPTHIPPNPNLTPNKKTPSHRTLSIVFWLIQPILFFIFSLSILPHKEIRFIFYVFPVFAAFCALSFVLFIEFSIRFSIVGKIIKFIMNPSFHDVVEVVRFLGGGLIFGDSQFLQSSDSQTSISSLVHLLNEPPISTKIVMGLIISSCCATFVVSCYASINNYPGGYAALSVEIHSQRLFDQNQNKYQYEHPRVYFDNFACQTGLSRFVENPNWIVFKSGQESDNPNFDPKTDTKGVGGIYQDNIDESLQDVVNSYDPLIFVVSRGSSIQSSLSKSTEYTLIDTIHAFGGVSRILAWFKHFLLPFKFDYVPVIVPSLDLYQKIY